MNRNQKYAHTPSYLGNLVHALSTASKPASPRIVGHVTKAVFSAPGNDSLRLATIGLLARILQLPAGETDFTVQYTLKYLATDLDESASVRAAARTALETGRDSSSGAHAERALAISGYYDF